MATTNPPGDSPAKVKRTVRTPIELDGKAYKPGKPIVLTEDQAAELDAVGALEPTKPGATADA